MNRIKVNYYFFYDFFLNTRTVDDASGRFTNGFFWGNSYFMGSATECHYIGQNYIQKNVKIEGSPSSIEEVREFNEEPRKKFNTGLSGANSWSNVAASFDDTPPYRLGFYMMRLSVNTSRYMSVRIELTRLLHNERSGEHSRTHILLLI